MDKRIILTLYFKNHIPKGYIKVVASPGETGSIKLTIFNYTNKNEKILVLNWHWVSYKIISEKINRELINYDLFNEKGYFKFNPFKDQFLNISYNQERVFTIFNTPVHNTTGYTIDDEEWDKNIRPLKKVSSKDKKKIILFIDIVYIDF